MNKSNPSRPIELDVYVAAHCWQCPAARALAEEMAREFPTLAVQVIDLDQPGAPQPREVFAVPTFLLNGKMVSLGTPFRQDLARHIRRAFKRREDRVRDGYNLRQPRKDRLPARE